MLQTVLRACYRVCETTQIQSAPEDEERAPRKSGESVGLAEGMDLPTEARTVVMVLSCHPSQSRRRLQGPIPSSPMTRQRRNQHLRRLSWYLNQTAIPQTATSRLTVLQRVSLPLLSHRHDVQRCFPSLLDDPTTVHKYNVLITQLTPSRKYLLLFIKYV